jgi:hypothetical protein
LRLKWATSMISPRWRRTRPRGTARAMYESCPSSLYVMPCHFYTSRFFDVHSSNHLINSANHILFFDYSCIFFCACIRTLCEKFLLYRIPLARLY